MGRRFEQTPHPKKENKRQIGTLKYTHFNDEILFYNH